MVQLDGIANIQAIVFDVYGTLASINDKRSPFARLLALGEQRGRPKSVDDARVLMGRPLTLQDAAILLRIDLAPEELAGLESDLKWEVESIVLYPDVVPTIQALQAGGIKVALCSNLAAPYAPPVKALLPMRLDFHAWSFEIDAIKPDRQIFEYVCEGLDCSPQQVLMVGDTPAADVEGPRAFGMQSILLDRRAASPARPYLSSLTPLVNLA